MKIVVVGGHLTPALAVIEKLPKTDQVYYIGRKNSLTDDPALSLEYKTIEALGIPFINISTGKLQKGSLEDTLDELFKIPVGVFQSIKFLRKTKPNVVVSFGSYVSLPVAFASFLLGIPLVIHEQTQEAGFSNLIESHFASKILISFESSRKYFPKKKTILVGNPIRESVLSPKKTSKFRFAEELPTLYITGGSQGSHRINQLVQDALGELLQFSNVIHQTGDSKYNDYQSLSKAKKQIEKLGQRYKTFKFLATDEVGSALSAADLVIGRAGANTVNEIIYFKKPAILIPLSISQKEEQFKNAQLTEDLGLGVVLSENVEKEVFLKTIKTMLGRLDRYRLETEIDNKNSARLIINTIRNVAKKDK